VKLKLLLLVLAITALIVLQNSQMVHVRLLWWSTDVAALLVMVSMLLLGFLLGYGVHYLIQNRHRHQYEKKIWSQ